MGGRTNKFGSTSKRPVNILNEVITSPLKGMETQALQSLLAGEVMEVPVTNLVAYLNCRYVPRGLANRLAYHIQGVDALRPRIMG